MEALTTARTLRAFLSRAGVQMDASHFFQFLSLLSTCALTHLSFHDFAKKETNYSPLAGAE